MKRKLEELFLKTKSLLTEMEQLEVMGGNGGDDPTRANSSCVNVRCENNHCSNSNCTNYGCENTHCANLECEESKLPPIS